jgi:hypothetical protein
MKNLSNKPTPQNLTKEQWIELFNNTEKNNQSIINLWEKILDACPDFSPKEWETLVERANLPIPKNKQFIKIFNKSILFKKKYTTEQWDELFNLIENTLKQENISKQEIFTPLLMNSVNFNPNFSIKLWETLINNSDMTVKYDKDRTLLHCALSTFNPLPNIVIEKLVEKTDLYSITSFHESPLLLSIRYNKEIKNFSHETWQKLYETFNGFNEKHKHKIATVLAEEIFLNNFNQFTPVQNIKILEHYNVENNKLYLKIKNYIDNVKLKIKEYKTLDSKLQKQPTIIDKKIKI